MIFFVALFDVAQGEPRGALDQPLLVGPQYPLLFMSTTFEPNTAFLLSAGQFFFHFSYTTLNTYVLSNNSNKANNPAGSADIFDATDSKSYSVYFDGELDRRFVRLYYGFSDNIELQYTYRQIRFFPGDFDASIENFHNFLDIGNQGRENTDRDLLEIYIHDNSSQENVFILTEESAEFHQESMTLGLKFLIRETASEAISFKVASNFGDHYVEREINQAPTTYTTAHRNFNDINYSFFYSSLFTDWTLNTGFSISFINESLLEKSPSEIYFFFLGVNWHLSDSWDWLIQTTEYSSPFPKDNVSSINADVREITSGFRWMIGKQVALDFGFVQNQSQGPQNIDIAFFSNLMFYL